MSDGSHNNGGGDASDGGQAQTDHGQKTKVTWYLSSFGEVDDEYNPRHPDGRLKRPEKYAPLPAEFGDIQDEVAQFWDEFEEIHARPFYDPETLALGTLPKNLYLLIPNSWDIPVCDPKDVGKGIHDVKLPMDLLAGVYALAKRQYEEVNKDSAVRWATLRLEAVKEGWLDDGDQKYVKRVIPPKDAMKIFQEDELEIKKVAEAVRQAVRFIPFLTEFNFRVYGVAYDSSTHTHEYLARAEKLAKSAQLGNILGYMVPDVFYGSALRWIEVKRPMEVLKAGMTGNHIPNVFRVRAYSGPSGQALITTSYAAIKSLMSKNWWNPIIEAGRKVGDRKLIQVAEKIIADPWKYHLISHAYGLSPLTADEAKDVEEAKKIAIEFAPILQAYCETIMKTTDLGNAKALKKHASSNMALYIKAQGFFRAVGRAKNRDVTDMFAVTVSPGSSASGSRCKRSD